MNNVPISAGGPIKDSIGRGKRIARKVVKTIEKPNYKSMIKEKKISIAKSLDNIIEKCEEVSKQSRHPGSPGHYGEPKGTTPRIVPPNTIKKEGKFGGFKDIVGSTKIKPLGNKPIFFKPDKPIAKGGFGSGRKPGDPGKLMPTRSPKEIATYGPRKVGGKTEFSTLPPITKGKADWQTPPFPPGSPDLIKPIKKIAPLLAAGIGAALASSADGKIAKPIPSGYVYQDGKMPKVVKSLEIRKAEDLIFLKADRLGHIISKDYEKVDDFTLIKEFGCIAKIPETIMKDEDGRPPKKWFDACLSRAEKWADDPAKACGALWHDPEKWDVTRGDESPGKGEATKEAYGKGTEGVSKMVDPEGQKGEADIINPDKPKISDLEPSEKNISS